MITIGRNILYYFLRINRKKAVTVTAAAFRFERNMRYEFSNSIVSYRVNIIYCCLYKTNRKTTDDLYRQNSNPYP